SSVFVPSFQMASSKVLKHTPAAAAVSTAGDPSAQSPFPCSQTSLQEQPRASGLSNHCMVHARPGLGQDPAPPVNGIEDDGGGSRVKKKRKKKEKEEPGGGAAAKGTSQKEPKPKKKREPKEEGKEPKKDKQPKEAKKGKELKQQKEPKKTRKPRETKAPKEKRTATSPKTRGRKPSKDQGQTPVEKKKKGKRKSETPVDSLDSDENISLAAHVPSAEETTDSTDGQVKRRKYNEDLDFKVVDDDGETIAVLGTGRIPALPSSTLAWQSEEPPEDEANIIERILSSRWVNYEPDEDLFNPDYIEVDRVLEVAHTKDTETGEEHKVLLTGTPLQNSVEELFSLLNFLEPVQFPSESTFLDEFGDLKTEEQVKKLQALLKPMMLRRLKDDVEKNLAPKEETIIEVELTNIQKKYYRAILEKNFTFLAKGANQHNMPNLINTMMELRKCCNHPYLITGAEEKILEDFRKNHSPEAWDFQLQAMIQAAGKLVLINKLLPKLIAGGHKVLIFSQMVRCLDILEDYLIQRRYTYERIDGRVRGNLRQAAIDRFCKVDSDRFVFLLCTRAGGLGINLTAADTCIIFDSDWNPQNDLQAQARCHRIGQSKAVKVYRLITRNSYEREMFDKASLKLGLDKAVLQDINKKGSTNGVSGVP
ncbi:UNVERIFIED_CONTAM: hypothetical protein FKN15_053493, partial [Acipenser sinensis]